MTKWPHRPDQAKATGGELFESLGSLWVRKRLEGVISKGVRDVGSLT